MQPTPGPEVFTAADGRFVLPVSWNAWGHLLLVSEHVVLDRRSRGLLHAGDVFKPIDPPGGNLGNLVVRTSASVLGVVRDRSGSPVEDARMRIPTGCCFGLSARTAADGTFEISRVAPGEYRLSVESPHRVPWTSKPFRLRDGEQRRFDVVLERARRVRGVVVDDRGIPVWHAAVGLARAVFRSEENRWTTSLYRSRATDRNGRFLLEGLPRRPIRLLAVTFRHHSWGPVEVPVGVTEVRLVLLRAATIDGRAVDRAGHALPHTQVDLRSLTVASPDPIHETLETEDDGSFEYGMLPPGSYALALEGSTKTRRIVHVSPGETLSVRLVGRR